MILVAFFIGPKCSLGPKAPYSLCSFFLMHRSKSFMASGTWKSCKMIVVVTSPSPPGLNPSALSPTPQPSICHRSRKSGMYIKIENNQKVPPGKRCARCHSSLLFQSCQFCEHNPRWWGGMSSWWHSPPRGCRDPLLQRQLPQAMAPLRVQCES